MAKTSMRSEENSRAHASGTASGTARHSARTWTFGEAAVAR